MDAGSDSCPSEDNIDLKQLYDIMYCMSNISAKTLMDKQLQEDKFEKDFAVFKKKVKRRVREASRDSSQNKNFSPFVLSSNQVNI